MKKILRKSKGITLIALVITIIVLLILAGVAIAMLSGENGILRKAAESKTKTEEGQKEEMGSLLSYEMALNLDSGYKYQYGCITGFEYDRSNNRTVESVENFEDKLPDGYKVTSKYSSGKDEPIEESEKATTYIATGMAITKDGKEAARTVLFGDADCNGKIDGNDIVSVSNYASFFPATNYKEFQKIASNVCDDDKINIEDVAKIRKYILPETEENVTGFSQNVNIKTSPKTIRRLYAELQEYIQLLDNSTGYSFEYNEEKDTYKLKGVKRDTKVSALIAALPKSDEIKIYYKKGDENRFSYFEADENDNVLEGYYVCWSFKDAIDNDVKAYFAYIEVEE